MTFIGFSINKKEREELSTICREMATMTFKHPMTQQGIQFLPAGAGLGTLVKVATSEYIRYFNALKQGAQPKATPLSMTQQRLAHEQSQDQVSVVAQQAVARSVAMRSAIEEAGGNGEAE